MVHIATSGGFYQTPLLKTSQGRDRTYIEAHTLHNTTAERLRGAPYATGTMASARCNTNETMVPFPSVL